MQGTVKWFDEAKEFGFIAAADGSADLLLEAADIPDQFRHLIQEGCHVDFRIVVGMKGPQARQVQPVGARTQQAEPAQAQPAQAQPAPASAPPAAEQRARCA